jgi:hypothetical protein
MPERCILRQFYIIWSGTKQELKEPVQSYYFSLRQLILNLIQVLTEENSRAYPNVNYFARNVVITDSYLYKKGSVHV